MALISVLNAGCVVASIDEIGTVNGRSADTQSGKAGITFRAEQAVLASGSIWQGGPFLGMCGIARKTRAVRVNFALIDAVPINKASTIKFVCTLATEANVGCTYERIRRAFRTIFRRRMGATPLYADVLRALVSVITARVTIERHVLA